MSAYAKWLLFLIDTNEKKIDIGITVKVTDKVRFTTSSGDRPRVRPGIGPFLRLRIPNRPGSRRQHVGVKPNETIHAYTLSPECVSRLPVCRSVRRVVCLFHREREQSRHAGSAFPHDRESDVTVIDGVQTRRHSLRERPVLDFSGMVFGSTNRGINLKGRYWYVRGIEVLGAGDNGMNISGSYNTVENCSFAENRDTGLQLGGGGIVQQDHQLRLLRQCGPGSGER